MSRQHFVHGFLEYRRRHRLRAQGRDGHPRRPLQGDGAAGGRRAAPEGPRARDRGEARARAHEEEAQDHHAGADDDHRHHRGPPLRRQGQDGDGVRRPAQPGSARAAGRRRRRDPVRRAGVQRLHGRGRGLGHRGAARGDRGRDLHHRGAHLLRLRHQGQCRLEGDARQRVAPVREDLSRAGEEPHRTRSRSNAATRRCR